MDDGYDCAKDRPTGFNKARTLFEEIFSRSSLSSYEYSDTESKPTKTIQVEFRSLSLTIGSNVDGL